MSVCVSISFVANNILAFTLWLGVFEITWGPKQIDVLFIEFFFVFLLTATNFTDIEKCATQL